MKSRPGSDRALHVIATIVALGAVGSGRAPAEAPNPSAIIEAGGFPVRVHVFEDYETEIEKRWWLRGTAEIENLAPSRSRSIPNRRAFRAASSRNFDRKMGDQEVEWKAVIFNPVPGPPMGPRTRLSFRYHLEKTSTLRVQIYSLTNNYHRFLTLTDLPTGRWREATVDMTAARRPDGSGGPLAEDERIDDIQFYIDPTGELLVDDIVLYEAAPAGEARPFPTRPIFTGWFDTGEQGREWPGRFEIVPHEKPRTWDAARSVPDAQSGRPILRVHLRGTRLLSSTTNLFLRYHLAGDPGPLRVVLRHGDREVATATFENPLRDGWSEATLSFRFEGPLPVDDIIFHPPAGATLQVDDLLLFEPAD